METALAVTAAKFWTLPEKLLEGISMDVDHRAGTAVRAFNIVISSRHLLSLPKHRLQTLTNGWESGFGWEHSFAIPTIDGMFVVKSPNSGMTAVAERAAVQLKSVFDLNASRNRSKKQALGLSRRKAPAARGYRGR